MFQLHSGMTSLIGKIHHKVELDYAVAQKTLLSLNETQGSAAATPAQSGQSSSAGVEKRPYTHAQPVGNQAQERLAVANEGEYLMRWYHLAE
jgi:hypothetical protein